MFVPVMRDIQSVEPFVFKGGTLLKTGMAVTVNTSDKFVKATGATLPTHIIMGEKKDGVYAAIRVLPTTVFQTTSSPAVDTVGKAVQIASDGETVNATTGGAFHIEYTENADNGVVRGRFKEVTA